MRTQNRIALVTGAARGIGLACARGLLETGNKVVVTDIAAPDPALLSADQRERVWCAPLDVRDTQAAAALLETIKSSWGLVAILVNNAGISPKLPDGTAANVMTVSDAEWVHVFDVNLNAILHLCQLAAPHMQGLGWGRIINMASLAGRARARVAGPSYVASKSALIGLTRSLAEYLGPWAITSNCVAPGRILTEMAIQAGEAVNRAYAEGTPLKRLGTPKEVAAAVVFLASEEAGFINGAVIDVNGGSFMPA
jgi:3-oxoacyl-[acyl-carrier protein] reductase